VNRTGLSIVVTVVVRHQISALASVRTNELFCQGESGSLVQLSRGWPNVTHLSHAGSERKTGRSSLSHRRARYSYSQNSSILVIEKESGKHGESRFISATMAKNTSSG